MDNIDKKVVESFGEEWIRYDQSRMTDAEINRAFEEYFAVFPWEILPPNSEGFDMGCGSGRWARLVAPRVSKLHCIDPSNAINIARKNLTRFENVEFHNTSLDKSPLRMDSQDFGYSLGVVHHVPDTAAAIRSCVHLLKPSAPLLLYVYYAFDNRPIWFKFIWRLSDLVRRVISCLPNSVKFVVTDIIACIVYWPLSRFAFYLEKIGLSVQNFPLYYYRNRSFYTMRTDSRDRFGTSLEKRFTKLQLEGLMSEAGLVNIRFSDKAPFWCAVGIKG